MPKHTNDNEVQEIEIMDDGQTFYPMGDDLNRDEIDIMHEEEEAEKIKREKAEIKRNNAAMVNELKSTVRTVIIALDRPITASEIQDSVEFFMDTAVDVKLINRAMRALVKENRLEKNDNGSYQLPATRKHMFDTLAAYKSQTRPIGR